MKILQICEKEIIQLWLPGKSCQAGESLKAKKDFKNYFEYHKQLLDQSESTKPNTPVGKLNWNFSRSNFSQKKKKRVGHQDGRETQNRTTWTTREEFTARAVNMMLSEFGYVT